MSEINLIEQSLATKTAFDSRLAALDGMPHWLMDIKKRAWETFSTMPMPNKKDKQWRFASTDNLTLDGYRADGSQADNGAIVELNNLAGRIDFAEDCEINRVDISEELKAKGVIFESIREAIYKHADLVRKHIFERLPNLGSEKFEALHQALFTNGVFLYVPKGVTVEQPLVTVHNATLNDSALFPHTLMVLEENAEATLMDLYMGPSQDTRHFVCAMSDIYAGESARLNYSAVQNWNHKTTAFHLNSVTAEKEAFVKTVTVNTGGIQVRNEQHGRILGSGADVNMHSLGVAKGNQELDQRTLQSHVGGQSRSDLLYKNALLDEAKTIFSGLIKVEEEAQQTDAYETNRNLLLNPNAVAHSLPGLEIEANDVKCSHGATTGQIDDSELFYFLARGIPKVKAQELLVFGFFEEIINKLTNEELQKFVRKLVRSKFVD
jgi:Fe-S cluster assembly protein SufD